MVLVDKREDVVLSLFVLVDKREDVVLNLVRAAARHVGLGLFLELEAHRAIAHAQIGRERAGWGRGVLHKGAVGAEVVEA